MTALAKLVVGQAYFMATYPDRELRKPIIITYEYLGKDIHGTPVNPADSGYHFKFLPPFHYCEPGTTPDPCETLHWFSAEQVSSLLDINELVLELKKRSEVGPSQ